MPQRLLGVLAIAFLVLGVLAGPVAATEGGETAPVAEEQPHSPTIEEIGQRNEITEEFRPEASELPPWSLWLLYPLLAVGILAAAMLLMRYLQWQPRFAEERRNRRRR